MINKLSAEQLRQHKGVSFVGVTTAFYCHDGGGEFFMGQRSKNARDEHGKWDFGGGGLKWGNTLEKNVETEIYEEYNATALTTEFLGYRNIFREMTGGTKTHWLAMDFLVLINRQDIKINEPDMFDDSGWFRLDHLPTPLHSQIPTILKKYAKEFKYITSKNKE